MVLLRLQCRGTPARQARTALSQDAHSPRPGASPAPDLGVRPCYDVRSVPSFFWLLHTDLSNVPLRLKHASQVPDLVLETLSQ